MGWARLTLKFPRVVLTLAALSCLLCLYVSAGRIGYSTDRTQLLNPDHPVQRSWQAYREEFEGSSDLLILITGSAPEVRAAAEDLGRLLQRDTGFFDDVFFKIELPEISRHALYFLSLKDLNALVAQLIVAKPWMNAMAEGLPGLLEKLSLIHPAAKLEPMLPLFVEVLTGINQSIASRGQIPYQSPLPAFQPEAAMLQGQSLQSGQSTFYNTIQGDGTCLMLVQPSDRSGSFQRDEATVARLRLQVTQVLRSYPMVQCMVCGEGVMNTDEMVESFRDMRSSGLIAMVLSYVLLAMAFNDLVRPLCAVVSLAVGLTWSLAFTSLAVGSLNLLTVHFATIVAGLSMTFAIQVLCQYLELGAREPGHAPVGLLLETMGETGPASFIGAVTTAIAFWSLHFTNFRAASELGLITGTGVLFCYMSVNTILPELLNLSEEGKACRAVRLPGWARWSQPLAAHP